MISLKNKNKEDNGNEDEIDKKNDQSILPSISTYSHLKFENL
jgi:hypothetical protein